MESSRIADTEFIVFDQSWSWAQIVKLFLVKYHGANQEKVMVFNNVNQALDQIRDCRQRGIVPVVFSDFRFFDPKGIINNGVHLFQYCQKTDLPVRFVLLSACPPGEAVLRLVGIEHSIFKGQFSERLPEVLAEL